MSEELLAKEKEFRRLNKELEEKTRDLMKKVNSVIDTHVDNVHAHLNRRMDTSRPDDVSTDVKKLPKERTINELQSKVAETSAMKRNTLLPRVCQQIGSNPLKQKSEMTNIDHNEIMSGNGNSLGNKAIVSFLNAKIDILHNELQTVQLEYQKKTDYCKEIEMENKKLEDTKIKLSNQIGALKQTISKLDHTNNDLQTKCQSLTTENTVLRKDVDELTKQNRLSNQQCNNYELRLNRSSETTEKLRNALKYSHIEEKELREQIRKLHEDRRLTIKNLEKQRSELVHAFKKQMFLIDNLKKQNAYLLANRQLELTQEDFSKLLDWKPQYVEHGEYKTFIE